MDLERSRHLEEPRRREEVQCQEDLSNVSVYIYMANIATYPFQAAPCQAGLLHSLEGGCSRGDLRMFSWLRVAITDKRTGIAVHID